MEQNINFKELYDVSLKSNLKIEIGGRTIEPGEVIARFDRIQLGTFQEDKTFTSARGGANNLPQVWWEESNELDVVLAQGIFSLPQLSVLTGSRLMVEEGPIVLSKRELLETDESCRCLLAADPISYFCYDADTGEKLTCALEGRTLTAARQYENLIVDYTYEYQNGGRTLTVGRALTNGYVALEGKTRVKDDASGRITTGIIKIPKLKLMSELSIRLGKDGRPMVGTIRATAYPDGPRGSRKLMDVVFLEEDLDSDI